MFFFLFFPWRYESHVSLTGLKLGWVSSQEWPWTSDIPVSRRQAAFFPSLKWCWGLKLNMTFAYWASTLSTKLHPSCRGWWSLFSVFSPLPLLFLETWPWLQTPGLKGPSSLSLLTSGLEGRITTPGLFFLDILTQAVNEYHTSDLFLHVYGIPKWRAEWNAVVYLPTLLYCIMKNKWNLIYIYPHKDQELKLRER